MIFSSSLFVATLFLFSSVRPFHWVHCSTVVGPTNFLITSSAKTKKTKNIYRNTGRREREREIIFYLTTHSTHFYLRLYGVRHMVKDHSDSERGNLLPTQEGRKEGNILFMDALNKFYLRLYGVRHMVKDHSDSERGNPLPPHRLLFPISSKGSFICIIPQTG